MKLVEYDSSLHESFIRSWLKSRNLSEDVVDNFPLVGLMVFHNEVPICAGFLRQIEGGFGLFDGLCTNPKMDSTTRHQALDILVKQIIQVAQSMEMKSIVAWSVDMGTLERSERHGFKRVRHQMINLNLSPSLH